MLVHYTEGAPLTLTLSPKGEGTDFTAFKQQKSAPKIQIRLPVFEPIQSR